MSDAGHTSEQQRNPHEHPDSDRSFEHRADEETPFLSHLVELRARLLRAVLAIIVVFLCLMPLAKQLYTLMAAPMLKQLPEGTKMLAIDVTSPFFVQMKLAFVVAVMIAMPFLLYQAWAFVAPGLYRNEQRLAKPLLVSATLLFYTGCAFAYFLVLPTVIGFIGMIMPEGVDQATDIAKYLDFVLALFLGFGICFEVPVAVVILAAAGIVTTAQLASARRYVLVGAFVVAAILTPPDVASQLLLAIPMTLLYEAGLIAARLLVRQREREKTEKNEGEHA